MICLEKYFQAFVWENNQNEHLDWGKHAQEIM